MGANRPDNGRRENVSCWTVMQGWDASACEGMRLVRAGKNITTCGRCASIPGSAQERPTTTVSVATSEASPPPSPAPGFRALSRFPLDTRPRVE